MPKKQPQNPHKWKGEDGDINIFAYSSGRHNGPECKVCGYYFCHHCNPEGYETECGDVAPEIGDDSNIDPALAALDAFVKSRLINPN